MTYHIVFDLIKVIQDITLLLVAQFQIEIQDFVQLEL